jgi:hypothetical protein
MFYKTRRGKSLECGNSWGGCARIWDSLYDKYCKDPAKEYDCWSFGSDKLWALARDDRLSLMERGVLMSTFDWALVMGEHAKQHAGFLRGFATLFPVPGKVDHLNAWADFMDAHPKAHAFGIYATSVGDNLWQDYSIKNGTKHWSVYK